SKTLKDATNEAIRDWINKQSLDKVTKSSTTSDSSFERDDRLLVSTSKMEDNQSDGIYKFKK
ncbi:MAG: hypothetical protein DSY43_04945, partial [Gammaproteobacteria bacterium]